MRHLLGHTEAMARDTELHAGRLACIKDEIRQDAESYSRRNLDAAADRLLDAMPYDEVPPRLAALTDDDYAAAHRDAEDPERWDLCS